MERLLKFLHKLWNRAQPGLKRAFLLPPKVIAVLVPTTMVLCIAALNTQGKHPVLSASKALNFAGALMSVFNLENAMTSRFSTDVDFRRIMNTAVGLTVCLLELATAVFIIVRSQLSLKKMEEKQSCT